MSVMAMISDFVFTMNETDFNALTKNCSYGFAEIQKAQDYAGTQSTGKEAEDISISGSVTTLSAGINPLMALYKIASKKEAVSFILGYGLVLGDYVITKISENESIFLDDGCAIKVDFTIDLKKVYA